MLYGASNSEDVPDGDGDFWNATAQKEIVHIYVAPTYTSIGYWDKDIDSYITKTYDNNGTVYTENNFPCWLCG